VIVVDTNVLYALADRRDKHHPECRAWLRACYESLLVPPTVLAEACYLVDKFLGAAAEATFLDSVGKGPAYRFQLAELADADVRRMSELVRKYSDRRLGGTDASVIAICERLAITTVATVNYRDFANVRPLHAESFTIVPAGSTH
jgi:predicted nucleic acid-binding protein